MRGMGNMTKVEKGMNKDDLIAYKQYDNKQYSLIPGVSKEKAIMERHRAGTQPSELRDSPGKGLGNKFYEQ